MNTSLPGSPRAGLGRWEKAWGIGFWGTNPHRDYFERANMCLGRQKNTSPRTWENIPPREKAHLHMGKIFSPFHTPKTGVLMEEEDTPPPSCLKAQVQRKEWASQHGKNTRPREETRVHRLLLQVWSHENGLWPRRPSCLPSGISPGRGWGAQQCWGGGPPQATPYTRVVEWGWGSVLL